MENSLEIKLKKKKKNLGKFCMKMPLGPSGQEFWTESNFCVFTWKLVDSIYRGKETNRKFLRKKPKKKKKKLSEILYENAPKSDWTRILTEMQCQHFCTKTCRLHI